MREMFLLLIALIALPSVAVAKPPSQEDIANLTEVIHDSNMLKEAGNNDLSQIVYEIYQKKDVQAAIRSIPELASKVKVGERERQENRKDIWIYKSTLTAQEKRLKGLEDMMSKMVGTLAKIETGVVVALNYIGDQKTNKERLKDVFYGFLSGSILLLLNWIRTMKRDKALAAIANSHKEKK